MRKDEMNLISEIKNKKAKREINPKGFIILRVLL